MKVLSHDAWNYFLSLNFLSDRLSDKKLSDKKEQPRSLNSDEDLLPHHPKAG